MQYIANATEVQKIEQITMEQIGIPSLVLMEKASLAVAACVKSHCRSVERERIIAICGTGNNGGDGVAAARLLHEDGYEVEVLLVGNQEKMTEQLRLQVEIAEKLGVKILTKIENQEYTIIIDAMFGIGISRTITGEYAGWIEWMNEQNVPIISVDIPSGICATTGKVLGCAVKATDTVTFGVNKRGLVLFPGTLYAGRITVVDIGFARCAMSEVKPKMYTYTEEDVARLMPSRRPRTNKGSYGKVLIVAGSPGMSGACYLAAEAAYRMGCGLVKVLTAEENLSVIKMKLPEAIVASYDGKADDITSEWIQSLEWADVIAVGPGLGQSELAKELMQKILCYGLQEKKAVIIDADGLNLLAQLPEKKMLSENFILTPHLKEMSRLAECSVEEIKDRFVEAAQDFGGESVVVLKDARTVVAGKREDCYINTTGNNALATGGSGDVLCGMIAGLVAQGAETRMAAELAVCIHGLTAEHYTEQKSRYGMLASDIIKEIPEVLPF